MWVVLNHKKWREKWGNSGVGEEGERICVVMATAVLLDHYKTSRGSTQKTETLITCNRKWRWEKTEHAKHTQKACCL